MNKFERCEGSNREQVVDWMPDIDYPGASVCIYCSYGVMLVKGSVKNGESKSGFKTKVGKLKVHYVKWEQDTVQNRKEPVAMRYKK